MLSYMARRKSPDLTIRLTVKERALLDKATARSGTRGVSTWARARLLQEAAKETDEERAARVERLIAQMRRGFPGAAEHADEVERQRRGEWKREGR